MVINNITIMLRSFLLQQIIKPSRRTLTILQMQPNYSNGKPPTDKVEISEKIVVTMMLIGGGCGSGYIGRKTYRETRDGPFTFSECVTYTSIMTIYGFLVGGAAVIVTPVVAPIALVIGAIRYFDPPNLSDETSSVDIAQQSDRRSSARTTSKDDLGFTAPLVSELRQGIREANS